MIGMEASNLSFSRLIDEERALKTLLDMFGSTFSLDELASAYCKANRDPDLAADILFEKQSSSSASSSSTITTVDESKLSSESSLEGNESVNDNPGPMLPLKGRPATIGSVSSIIGKGYVRTYRPKNRSSEATKPMKLDSSVLPESEIWGEDVNSNSNLKRNDSVHRDMEDFLFGVLGNGFKLERDVIRDVLDACGYDMPKSMERLFAISTDALDKNKFVCESSDKVMKSSSKFEVPSLQKRSTNLQQCNDDKASNSRLELSAQQRHKNDIERTVLTSLFTVEKREDLMLPKMRTISVKSAGIFGKPVSEPLVDSFTETSSEDLQEKNTQHDKEEEERFQATRKAVKEYYALAKEYYQSAVDAFSKGDRVKAIKLSEQGHFFHKKANEADEESSGMILETREEEVKNITVLDIHDYGAKEAIRPLKFHLSSLAGFPSKYLKVIIETNGEDNSKGSRKRLVLKLLEKESIKWEEEENGGTILIQLDRIDRKKLSFAKK